MTNPFRWIGFSSSSVVLFFCFALPAFGTTQNVQTFGATGDGSTDDTAAIQRAITALSSGDTLLFPCGAAGIYKVSSALTVTTQGVTIEGATGCPGGTVEIRSTISGLYTKVLTLGRVSTSSPLYPPGSGAVLLASTADQATSFTVNSTFASTLSPGDLVYIFEGGVDGNCSPGGTSLCDSNGSATAIGCEIDGCRGEVAKVASISGTTVNVTRPLNNPYNVATNRASVAKLTYVNLNSTVQNLIFDGSGTATIGLYILQTDGVTVTNVTGRNTTGSAISCGISGSTVCGWQAVFNNITVTAAGGNGGGNSSAFIIALAGYPTVNTARVGPNLNPDAFGVGFGMTGGGIYNNLTVDKGGTPTPTGGRAIKNSANAHATFANLTVRNAPANYNGMDLTYYSHHLTVNTCDFSANNTVGPKGFGNYNDYATFNNCTMTVGTNGALVALGQGASNNGRYDQNWTVSGGNYSGTSGYAPLQFSGNNTIIENATIGPSTAGIAFNVPGLTGICIKNNTFMSGMSYSYNTNGGTGIATGNTMGSPAITPLPTGSCGGTGGSTGGTKPTPPVGLSATVR